MAAGSLYAALHRKTQKVLTMPASYQPKRPPMDACPIEHVVALVGGKWKARALYLLSVRPFAFAELRRELGGVSQQVLSTQLKAMLRDGLVSTVVNDDAAATLYVATPKGCDLVKVLMPVAEWGTAELRRRGEDWQPPLAPLAPAPSSVS
ncbi:winged helix-turn-helix transcriptional regulator [Erythrobacter sp. WG]|uniref:winged helix-turn-helix transcriptional regulator n=1 Tax=Erythrobacter sp. WG TaxID=2985510 RepID=UPI00227183A6|nr:helix-turn-helix domain-containing protein [Erythrobacter sp. WG]MCX9146919.1 helix-turn-helix transcriptional regulator [Erythrobacter sp. WG]